MALTYCVNLIEEIIKKSEGIKLNDRDTIVYEDFKIKFVYCLFETMGAKSNMLKYYKKYNETIKFKQMLVSFAKEKFNFEEA